MVVELYPHQQKAVDQLRNGRILWGGVGTGKSRTALAYFYTKVCGGVYDDLGSMSTPMDIYIITTAKKRDSLDWEEEAAKFVINRDPSASVSGIKLTVDSWNNIERYVGVSGAFFIFDEQRLVGSGSWTKSFIKIAKSNQWILLSATPGDTWLDYIPVFVANGWYKNRTEFKRRHVIYNTYSKFPKVDRYVEVGHLVRLRNELLVHMPYPRHTVRKSTDVLVDYDQQLFERVVNDRWHVYENRPLRDVSELFSVMRKVVNSDGSRVESVRRLMERHKKVIVFYNFDYELEILRTLKDDCWQMALDHPGESFQVKELSPSELLMESHLNSSIGSDQSLPMRSEKKSSDGTSKSSSESSSQSPTMTTGTGLPEFSVAEWNGHKHEGIPKTDRWVYLVQYVAGAEGWNCIETDAMVFYSQTYSYKNYEQAQGRIDRLNTPFSTLYYYTLMSKSLIDRAIAKSLRNKQNFNESDYGRKMAA